MITRSSISLRIGTALSTLMLSALLMTSPAPITPVAITQLPRMISSVL